MCEIKGNSDISKVENFGVQKENISKKTDVPNIDKLIKKEKTKKKKS